MRGHKHILSKEEGICLTCGLNKKTYTLLDKLNKQHKPYSHHCSSCGVRITDREEFENFALVRFNSLHTNCEKCVKLFKKYNKQ